VDNVETAKILTALPLTVLLVLVLVGGYIEWWIYGTIHRRAIAERDQLIEIERGRAERWEHRFMEISGKLDLFVSTTAKMESQIDSLHNEVVRLQAVPRKDRL
jgi:hypothetical protein